MVQKKVHKSKLKAAQVRYKPKDGKEFNAQLETLGLKIVQITADGNCLFRAVADQLEGNEDEHSKYRKMVVDYIEAHRKDYEPFLEDDVPFDDYCKNMRDTSTWAGHMELQVISLVTHTNICIHRLLSPRWHINTFASTSVRCIHLSYHNGEHYNSVRRIDDSGGGPAKLILLETPVLEERKDGKGKAACKRYSFKNQTQQKAEAPVVEAQTIEKEPDVPLKLIGSENREDVSPESQNRTSGQVQKVARNKACPCGSKKKYKACCGAVMSKHRAQEMACSSTEVLSNKARKQNLRNNKGRIQKELEPVIAKETPDMGFLCI